MDGLINYGIVKPELAGAFGAGIRAQQDERMQNQLAQQKLAMGQMQQEQAGLQLEDFKRRQSALDQFVAKAQQTGRTGTPKELAQQFYDYAITAKEPQVIMAAQQALLAADEREKYLSERTGPAPTGAAPAMPTGALGSGTFGIMPETTNALAPKPAPAPSVNAMVDPATAIRNRIVDLEMRYPGGAAKREIGLLETQLKELEKQQVVAPGGSVFQGGRVVYTAPERQDTDLIRNFNAAKAQGFKGDLFEYQRQIAMAGRPPATPATPSAPVAVVDPTTGKPILVSREQAMGMTPANAMEGLTPKDIQKREAAYPKATSALKSFETETDAFDKDIERLRNHPGLSEITGLIGGRTPALTGAGRQAQALYEKITAKGGFQALQNMRNASPTGGALGNVSNQEGLRLEKSVAAIDRRQDAKDVQAALDTYRFDLRNAKRLMREAYEDTYSYKAGAENKGGAADPLGIR
jgi:hypothetical protein